VLDGSDPEPEDATTRTWANKSPDRAVPSYGRVVAVSQTCPHSQKSAFASNAGGGNPPELKRLLFELALAEVRLMGICSIKVPSRTNALVSTRFVRNRCAHAALAVVMHSTFGSSSIPGPVSARRSNLCPGTMGPT
jgi:hypothetical protein